MAMYVFRSKLQLACQLQGICTSCGSTFLSCWCSRTNIFPGNSHVFFCLSNQCFSYREGTQTSTGLTYFVFSSHEKYILHIFQNYSHIFLAIFDLQAMTMMGLYDTAYWLSWFTWEGIMTLLSTLITLLFGMMFQFDFFLNNSFAVLFMLFFLFQFNMVRFIVHYTSLNLLHLMDY